MNINWGLILTPVLTVLVFGLLAKFKYLKPDSGVPPMDKSQFNKLNARLLLIFFPLATALATVLYFLSVWAFEIYWLSTPEKLLLPQLAFSFPAIVVALVLAGLMADWRIKNVLGSEYPSFASAEDRLYGVNNYRLKMLFVRGGIPICILLSVYMFWCNSFLVDDQVHIRRFGTFHTVVYSTEDLREIAESKTIRAPNGNLVRRNNFRVFFKDGYDWKIDDEGDGRNFLETLSAKSRLPIIYRDIE